jgi:hypothetical protein
LLSTSPAACIHVGELPPTAPTHCALMLALPSDQAAVQGALEGGPYTDYVCRGATRGNAAILWHEGFSAVAAAARALADGADKLGVMVEENATLQALARAFSVRSVITVVGHWRGSQISKQDILGAPEKISQRIAEDQSELPLRLRGGLAPNWRDRLLKADTDAARRSKLAELLDLRLSQEPCLRPPPPGTEWHMDLITLRHENRAALDAWWPEAFSAGNKLELADGLHAPKEIAAIVPERWGGIIDLSNCQSAQLIDVVKRHREDRIVIANERETNPARRLGLLLVVYELLAKSKINYVDARVELAAKMRR